MPKRIRPHLFYSSHQSCGGKTSYPRRHEADQAAQEIMIMQPDLQLRTYKCTDCRTWHLTRAQTNQQIENY